MSEQCVRGYFKKLGRGSPEYPFVDAKIYINNEYKGIISFLIDSGAGATLIVFKDALKLNILPKKRKQSIKIVGISGSEIAEIFRDSIRVEILDNSEEKSVVLDLKEIQIEFSNEVRKRMRRESMSAIMSRPSLLGWDVLRYFKIIIDYQKKIIILCKKLTLNN